MHSRGHRLLVTLVSTLLPFASSEATSLLPGDILVSSSSNLQTGVIREYTPSGVLVQTFSVPAPSGTTPIPRDIATDSFGRINIWNGTFTPVFTTGTPGVLPGEATWVNHTMAEWNTTNATYYTGIAVSGNYAYVTDMVIGGDANGIVRFDLTNFSATRFGQGQSGSHGDYIDLNIGLDGLLYGLFPGGSPSGTQLDVFDPQSMTLLRTLNLHMETGAIAVDQFGNIFATSPFDSRIFRFDATGTMTGSLVTGTARLRDLDLSSDDHLLTIADDGHVILADTSLTTMTSFAIPSAATYFGAFVSPVPEPAPGVLIIVGSAGALGFLRFNRRKTPPRRASLWE